jgi:hypothetical protein
VRRRFYALVLAGAFMLGLGLSTAGVAQAACNPNTGCLPRPTDVLEAGTGSYYVKPHTLYLLRGGPNVWITGIRWSTWSGGYGRQGLIGGSADGTGTLRAAGEGNHNLGRVTIRLYDVTNGGVNACTYYEKAHLTGGGKSVVHYWRWSNRENQW